jgi:adenylate kinase
MDVVLFGIQGSGKGTQARRLADEFGFDLFEAGGELRTIAASGTPLGDIVKSYIDDGKLVPFEIIMQVVREAIAKRKPDQRILFDGIPRDRDQMQSFNTIMEESSRDFQCVQILLDEEEAVQRILGRAAQEGRADDADESVIRRRMATFHEKTLPVIEAYQRDKKLVDVDGNADMDTVYQRILQAAALA